VVWENDRMYEIFGLTRARFLERHRQRIPAVALSQDREDLQTIHRGGMGVRGPSRYDDTVLDWMDHHHRPSQLQRQRRRRQGPKSRHQCRCRLVPAKRLRPSRDARECPGMGRRLYTDTHAGAPTDGSARPSFSGCSRVLRGGSWASLPRDLRSAARRKELPTIRFTILGFRVARPLQPG
jgi:hypothetical protein